MKSIEILAYSEYESKNYQEAIELYDKILDLNSKSYNALTMRAQCLEILNYNLDAIDDYNNALSIENSDGNIFGLLGLLYIKIGEFKKGLSNLQTATNLGEEMYQSNLDMFQTFSDGMIESMTKMTKTPENLKRRDKRNFSLK